MRQNTTKTSAMLMDEPKNYANPTSKIRRLKEKGELFSVISGLYETDKNDQEYYFVGSICGLSYHSLVYANGESLAISAISL